MRNFMVTLFFVLSGWAQIASADQGRLIVESDTGMVFGDLDCEIETHSAGAPRFGVDNFDYLHATVELEVTCVTRAGRQVTYRAQDTMAFTTLDFDWRDQAWYAGDTLIASRVGGWRVELNPELEYVVWTTGDSTHVALRVEVRARP